MHSKVYDEELLQYNFGPMRWVWNEDEVEQKVSTENVTSMLAKKLRHFDLGKQNIIKVSIYLLIYSITRGFY